MLLPIFIAFEFHCEYIRLSLQVHSTFTASTFNFHCEYIRLSLQVHSTLAASTFDFHCKYIYKTATGRCRPNSLLGGLRAPHKFTVNENCNHPQQNQVITVSRKLFILSPSKRALFSSVRHQKSDRPCSP